MAAVVHPRAKIHETILEFLEQHPRGPVFVVPPGKALLQEPDELHVATHDLFVEVGLFPLHRLQEPLAVEVGPIFHEAAAAAQAVGLHGPPCTSQ